MRDKARICVCRFHMCHICSTRCARHRSQRHPRIGQSATGTPSLVERTIIEQGFARLHVLRERPRTSQVCFRAKRKHLEAFEGPSLESQAQNLALTAYMCFIRLTTEPRNQKSETPDPNAETRNLIRKENQIRNFLAMKFTIQHVLNSNVK